LAREANQHFERAQELLRQGDWNGYGEEIKKLGEVLKRLAAPRPAERK
jgi:flagellin-specific chaperone FliS